MFYKYLWLDDEVLINAVCLFVTFCSNLSRMPSKMWTFLERVLSKSRLVALVALDQLALKTGDSSAKDCVIFEVEWQNSNGIMLSSHFTILAMSWKPSQGGHLHRVEFAIGPCALLPALDLLCQSLPCFVATLCKVVASSQGDADIMR